MPGLVLIIVLAVIVFLLMKSVADAQRAREQGAQPKDEPRPRVPRPAVPRPVRPRARQRRSHAPVDHRRLAEHVSKLRTAVAQGLISIDEAADSVVRHSDGQISGEAARRLVQEDNVA